MVADLHEIEQREMNKIIKVSEVEFDVIVTLGDIKTEDLDQIREAYLGKDCVGVLGNHDIKGSLGLMDISYRQINLGGDTLTGIDGSVMYKDKSAFPGNKNIDDYPMYTQEQMESICLKIPKSDIIISHNAPYGIHDDNTYNELGYKGLLDYIKRKEPKICLHGHWHTNKITKIGGTEVIGVYGVVILNTGTGQVRTIMRKGE